MVMLNVDRVLERCVAKGLITKADAQKARVLNYEKSFVLPGGGSFSAPTTVPVQQQNFSSAAIIVGIDADSQPDGQPVNPFLAGRERFEITFSYPTGDKLVNTLGLASAMFGRNGEKLFPSKEVFIPAQQNIQIDAQTRLPEQLLVTVDFAALIWTFAS